MFNQRNQLYFLSFFFYCVPVFFSCCHLIRHCRYIDVPSVIYQCLIIILFYSHWSLIISNFIQCFNINNKPLWHINELHHCMWKFIHWEYYEVGFCILLARICSWKKQFDILLVKPIAISDVNICHNFNVFYVIIS